jgi:undecaprenyl-phosphate 4-deoxy-4-formamido-L-arabinose transferase
MADRIDFSVVIPVYNSADTIEPVVEQVHRVFSGQQFEVVLVNDGSADHSERVCAGLVYTHPHTVRLVQLSRNFGEHSAVLAGLSQSRGQVVGIMDDDGQNPPEELLKLWRHQQQTGVDVVYGLYRTKRHGWWRNWGSWLHGAVATFLMGKPQHLYLSSFKVVTRFVVDQLVAFRGPFPYLDGLILRTTNSIGQIDVEHRPRTGGQSGYTFRKLAELSLNMGVGYSLAPLRTAVAVGAVTLLTGLLISLSLGITPSEASLSGWRTMWAYRIGLVCLTGVELMVLAVLGEYVGRVFLQLNGQPPYIIRYVRTGESADG